MFKRLEVAMEDKSCMSIHEHLDKSLYLEVKQKSGQGNGKIRKSEDEPIKNVIYINLSRLLKLE